jgi:RHS repeat-associated protein
MINKMVRLYAVIFLVSVAWMSYGQSTTAPQEIQVRTDARPVPAQASGPSYLLSTLNVTDLKDVFPACAGGDYYVGFQLSYDLSNNNTELAWAVDLGITLTDGVNNYTMPTLTVRMGDQTFLSTAFYNSAITCNSSYKVRIDTKTLTGTVPQTTVTLKVLLFKKFENVFTPAGTITVNSAYSNGTSTVSWNPHTTSIPATLGYDVEWVYIEQHEGFSGSAAEAFIFKEPVRITTATTSYSHLTYYPTGQIYYRVRAVGFDPQYPDHRLIGNWFYASSPISITNHNSGYTWQLQTIFAEEGKNKKIMGYYDGSLRQRQVLTNISSENVTVVGESAYDYEGRKSIDILPVPVTAVPVTWQNLVGVTVSGATLTKPSGTAAWNAGAASVQQIPANASGWLEIPIASITGNRMIGLSDADTDQTSTSIDFGYYLNGSSLRIYENGVSKYVVSGTLVVGDFVQIERIGSTVVYKKNGAIVYTSLTASTSVLIADASINSVGGTLSDISISDSPLRFKPDFNRFQSQSTLVTSKVTGTKRKFHYDNRDTLNSVISNLGGAGKYYSPLTAPPGTLKDYIPDAEGYVFSQTEYLNDGTGRVSKQSGVGQAFRMDDSHVTKNYYGSAAAAELQRLFGNNVGNASHYKKNLVVDPNGQVSVSYLDQEDRVIATALAGEKPANVDGLPSYTALGNDLIEVSLNSKNQKKEGVSVTSHKIMNVAVNTGYTFTYDLSALASEIETVGCVACGFDLTITVTDPNGNALDLSGQPGNESVSDNFVYARNNVTATSCGAPYTINTVELELTLPLIGDYTVTKTLRAKELTFESVLELISQTETVQDLIDEITVSYELDSADCEVCTTCDADDAINEAIEEIAELDCENILQRIIYELQMDSLAVDSLSTYEPSQDDIAAHPGYCEYELCVKNQASDAFEKQLARVADWDAADLLGYDTLINKDPFFNVDTLSGDGYKDEMQDLIDDIYLTKVDGNDLRGTLLEVTDPANEDYYVDEEGNGDPDGYHILYIDFMKAGYGPASPEIKEQRWELYKALYLEAKRKIKLTITGYVNCDSAYVKLQMQDGLPTTEEDIAAYGEAQGVGGDVSEEEVASSFYTIRNMCPDAVISESDSLTISSHLEAYFNNHPDNFYRIIILSDLNEDPDLDAIQDILTPLGCGLDSVALVDPITCARDTTIVYSQYSEILEEGCTGCRQAPARSEEVEKLQKQQVDNFNKQAKEVMLVRIKEEEEKVNFMIDESINAKKRKRINAWEEQVKAKTNSDPSSKKRSPGNTQNLITSDEYAALMALYASTGGPGWTHKNGWSTANPLVPQDVTGWYGIAVNGSGNVTAINLNGNNLNGTIPSQIGNLTYLVSLSLNTNFLTGSIPTTIGNLSNLQSLDLWNNQLSGSIPTQIGDLTNLTGLSLSSNQLSGSLPSSLGSLSNLTFLAISANPLLTGSIPTTLGSLSNLQILELAGNSLTGSIPYQLGSLNQLEVLTVHSNQLSGSIPYQLGSLSNLESLNLYHNQLTGSIPPQLGDLTNLQSLSLSVNQLSGSMPTDIGDLTNLTFLAAYSNQLTGSIPASLGSLSNLEYLDLADNNLTGSIPYQLGSLSELKALTLHQNELSDSIPHQLGSLSNLVTLYLHENDLTGSIPSTLGNLDNLLALYLSYNQLTGAIPGSLGNMDVLKVLSLENNQLSGSIPANLGSLSTLESFTVSTNSLSGSIPPELGAMVNLEAFHAQYNNLSGSIPEELGQLTKLKSLSLFSNNLTGALPASLGNLSELLALYLHYNHISDTIPSTLGNLSKLVTLELENNELVGPIPASLGQLGNLTSLGLHNNQLSGSIPKQLGNMHKLESFNVFNNQLTGSVPASFSNLEKLQAFIVNSNYLVGNLPKLDPVGLNTVMIENNKFTFSNFLPLRQSFTGSLFQYAPQDSVDQKKKVYGALGTKVKLISNIDRATSPSSKYQWFKNGVSLGSPSTTKHTLTIPSMSMSDVATYHYQITNPDPGATVLTLTSRPQQLVLSDSLISFTYCLEYDSTNETLNKFKFVVDWDAVVQQCMENAAKEDSILISRSVEVLLEEQATLFYNKQSTNCLDSITENFYYAYIPKEYHYTLYYYDQAGNLVQTVPPAGVDTEDQDHKLITRYTYNSINQLVWQKTPDAGESQFWYDDKGQLRLSQNAQQFKDDKYSYTQYDNQGRVVQVGELYTTENISSLKVKLEDPVFPINQGFTLKDVTKTYYDFPKTDIQSTFPQDYLRNRVSWTEVYENLENNTPELLTNGTFTGSLTGWTQTGASPHSWNWDSYLGGIAVVTLDGDVDSKSLGQSISPVTAGEIVTVKAEYVIDYAATPNSIKLLFCTTPGSVVQEIILSSDEAVGSYDKEITVTALANFSYVEVIVHATDESYYLNEISLKRENNVNATYYSYDVHGNVKALLQKIPNLGNKRTDYVYDLVSGKVNYAIYQYGQPDQFIHKYTYDADNRIKDVSTSTDGFLFDKEADYKYYQHGPLARVVLGEYTGVQGLDYYYTLQGWIKGVNMPYAADPGNDGYNPSKVGRDVFAYALGYYTEDYKPRTASKVISGVRDSLWTRYNAMYTSQGYYNGNIAWMETDLKKIGQQKGARVKGMQAMMYRYDQLHRIMQSRSLTNYSAADFKFLARTNPNEAYDEDFNYDPNGNLLTLERRDNTAAVLDNFNYTYYNNTNKLRYLNPVTRDTTYTGDIYGNDKLYDSITVASTANVPDGGNPTLRATSNIDFDAAFDLNDNAEGLRAYIIGDDEGEFNYDAIGNLVWDMGNGVRIAWTPYGKVRHVSKANGDSILYRYDAAGNRIEKRTVTAGIANTTYYVRDAGGNVMGTYHTGAAMNIEWINPVGVTVSGTTVTKPSGSNAWNAGASSLQILPAGINGYLEFKVTSVTGNRMVGFNDADADANYTGINYAVYLNGNSLKAYSNGTQVYDAGAASLAVNDVLKLERIGSTVYLRKNGTLAHTFALASGTSLVADMVINTVSSSIEGVTYFFGDIMVTEQPVYGSSRLGVYRSHRQPGIRQLGHKTYELSNHLGNVLATVSDNVRVRTDSAFANVVNSTDYYAFGSEMPTRTYSMNSDYRYGFNGKEQDTENTWGDDIYDYGFRIYNPKIGKFLSVDPLTKSYPMLTPYQFASNRPIDGVDLDGLEYLRADEARISIISGNVHLNLENCYKVTQRAWRERDALGRWPDADKNIGWPTQVAELTHPTLPKYPEILGLDNSYTPHVDIMKPLGQQELDRAIPTAKSTGKPDRRYKPTAPIPIGGGIGAGKAGTATAGAALIFNAITWGLEQWGVYAGSEDISLQREHLSILSQQVMADINQALHSGMIPEKYQNLQNLGSIANVVLSGVNPSDNQELYDVGIKIVKEISKNYQHPIIGEYHFKNAKGADAVRVEKSVPILKKD